VIKKYLLFLILIVVLTLAGIYAILLYFPLSYKQCVSLDMALYNWYQSSPVIPVSWLPFPRYIVVDEHPSASPHPYFAYGVIQQLYTALASEPPKIEIKLLSGNSISVAATDDVHFTILARSAYLLIQPYSVATQEIQADKNGQPLILAAKFDLSMFAINDLVLVSWSTPEQTKLDLKAQHLTLDSQHNNPLELRLIGTNEGLLR